MEGPAIEDLFDDGGGDDDTEDDHECGGAEFVFAEEVECGMSDGGCFFAGDEELDGCRGVVGEEDGQGNGDKEGEGDDDGEGEGAWFLILVWVEIG